MVISQHPPPPSDATFVALIGLVLLFWVGARVNILRRQMERTGPDGAAPAGAAWLRWLARWPWTYPVIGLVAAGFVAAVLLL